MMAHDIKPRELYGSPYLTYHGRKLIVVSMDVKNFEIDRRNPFLRY